MHRSISGLPALLPICLTVSGCAGIQSALDPAGTEAEAVARLFYVMLAGACVIWLAVLGIFYYASRAKKRAHSEEAAGRLILWGGAVFPVIGLTALLAYGLAMMPALRPWNVEASAEAPLRIEVIGEQFWWRVIYHRPGEEPVVSANEVRLPVGERVAFTLKSADVVHSFWIPVLGGKMDMIPGRANTLSLQANREGIYRGPCAEFCGTSHALMAFAAVVMEPAAFDAWLEQEARPSPATTDPGLEAFLANGCQSCHAIDGTEAAGTVGPDLSHVGSRQTIGAGILPNTEEAIARIIRWPDQVKPGIRMPSFHALPDEEIALIARYLKGLE